MPTHLAPRTRILYVTIDRPADAGPPAHAPNLHRLEALLTGYDRTLSVELVPLATLAGHTLASFESTYRPLAILGAGSFTEWFRYGEDPSWKRQLDHWMEMIREMAIPMLAICGSHQLVATAFLGFRAVGHMSNAGKPVAISDELSTTPPRPLWPQPRVGEEGTYPIVATAAGASDPLVRGTWSDPWVATHHKDMVLDAAGFTVLYRDDGSRPPCTRAADQATQRCGVQAMRYDDPKRLLYSTQFHPEMTEFDESTRDDGGFGAAFLVSFVELARGWWKGRPA